MVIPGRSWRPRLMALTLAACVCLCDRARAQTPESRLPDLPVTRLAGASIPPSWPSDRRPDQQPPPPGGMPLLPVSRLDERPRAADLDAPRTISLAISQPLPIVDMLVLLVRGTPFSVVADSRVDGTFSGELTDLTMRQAIEAVLFSHDLDYEVQGSLVRVFPRRPVTRVFEVDYLNLRRTWQRGTRATIDASREGVPAEETTSLLTVDVFEELGHGVAALLSASGRVHVDRGAGLVQVTDFADRLDQIGVYVEAVQARATRQVRLEARVFEVTLNDAAAASIDWNVVASRSGAALAGGLRLTAAGLTVSDFGALMKAIAEQGTVRTIAMPHLVAMNNQPAVMRVGTQEVYFVPASLADLAHHADDGVTASTMAEGLTLTVIPQIAADGRVQLSVAPTYAEKKGEAHPSKGLTTPIMSVSEVETLVRVQDGETVVVAGLIRDRERVTAGKGAGGIFGSQKRDTVKSELVILLTPTVVAPGAGAALARN